MKTSVKGKNGCLWLASNLHMQNCVVLTRELRVFLLLWSCSVVFSDSAGTLYTYKCLKPRGK